MGMPAVLSRMLGIGQLFLVAAGVLAIIAVLLYFRGCASTPANSYEHFDSDSDALVSTLTKKISEIQTIKSQIEADTDDLATTADDVCDIVKRYEAGFVDDYAALKDNEYDLPAEVQKKRTEERRRRGILAWKNKKEVWSAVNKKPLYECFYAEAADVEAKRAELETEVNELAGILDNATIVAENTKRSQLSGTVDFMKPLLVDATSRAYAVDAVKSEGFATSAADLIARANLLIGRAQTMHRELMNLKAASVDLKRSDKMLNQRQGSLSKGKLTPAEQQELTNRQLSA
jgi:hypothetical protein